MLLAVPDEFSLELAARRLRAHYIRYSAFREPDLGDSLTAIATEPVDGDTRRLFRKFPLLTSTSLGG